MGTRRDEILALATQLFAKQGVQATSMRDLANAAGIMPSSLYSHFESKEALADEILRDYLETFLRQCREIETTAKPGLDRLRRLIAVSVAATDSFPAALAIYHRDIDYLTTLPRFTYLFDLYMEVRAIWLAAIETAIEAGDIRNDVDPIIYYRWMRDGLTLTTRWREPGTEPDIESLTQFAERVFLRGMATDTHDNRSK